MRKLLGGALGACLTYRVFKMLLLFLVMLFLKLLLSSFPLFFIQRRELLPSLDLLLHLVAFEFLLTSRVCFVQILSGLSE